MCDNNGLQAKSESRVTKKYRRLKKDLRPIRVNHSFNYFIKSEKEREIKNPTNNEQYITLMTAITATLICAYHAAFLSGKKKRSQFLLKIFI